MTRRGRNAKFGYDSRLFVKFIDSYTSRVAVRTDYKRERDSRPTRQVSHVRFVNGVRLNQDVDGRKLRRWKHEFKTISLAAADRFCTTYGLTLTEFEQWCERKGKSAIVNNHT